MVFTRWDPAWVGARPGSRAAGDRRTSGSGRYRRWPGVRSSRSRGRRDHRGARTAAGSNNPLILSPGSRPECRPRSTCPREPADRCRATSRQVCPWTRPSRHAVDDTALRLIEADDVVRQRHMHRPGSGCRKLNRDVQQGSFDLCCEPVAGELAIRRRTRPDPGPSPDSPCRVTDETSPWPRLRQLRRATQQERSRPRRRHTSANR